jgi:hypothetical protein
MQFVHKNPEQKEHDTMIGNHPPPPPAMPFGKYRGVPLGTVPEGYIRWALRECKLSSGLRSALSAELTLRGVEVPPAPPPRPLPSCPRCPGVKPLLYWLQDSLGRKRIKIECARCHRPNGFAPTASPYVEEADAAASKTPVLDVLTRLEDLGIELLSDGKSIRYARDADYRRVPPDLRRLVQSQVTPFSRMSGA